MEENNSRVKEVEKKLKDKRDLQNKKSDTESSTPSVNGGAIIFGILGILSIYLGILMPFWSLKLLVWILSAVIFAIAFIFMMT